MYIEQYYNWIKENPDKVNKKVTTIYEKLVDDIKNPKEVTKYNSGTEENENFPMFGSKSSNSLKVVW